MRLRRPRQSTLTAEGTLLGTVQYMAPEQLEGREADARSDLFAFGAVLYEMLTGRRAFAGESQSKVMAAVLDAEPPPLPAARPLTPPVLEHLVRDLPGEESRRSLAECRRSSNASSSGSRRMSNRLRGPRRPGQAGVAERVFRGPLRPSHRELPLPPVSR